MSFVQQHDQVNNVWVKYHVASGDIVETSHKPFAGVDEIQPKVRQAPVREAAADPLDGFR